MLVDTYTLCGHVAEYGVVCVGQGGIQHDIYSRECRLCMTADHAPIDGCFVIGNGAPGDAVCVASCTECPQ